MPKDKLLGIINNDNNKNNKGDRKSIFKWKKEEAKKVFISQQEIVFLS